MSLKRTLEKLGLYSPLMKIKSSLNNVQYALEEKKNSKNRVDFYSGFLKPGDLVFDVGANVGNRVQSFISIGCKVVAVEPQPSCIAILKEKFGDALPIEAVGLGAADGELEMHLSDASTISTFSTSFIERTKDKFRYNKWEGTIKVPITRLESLIKKHGLPQFCKIDVEGFESEVLKGLDTPIPKLSFEYNVPEMQDNLMASLERLHQLSPSYTFNYSKEESMELALPAWLSYNDFVKLATSQAFLSTDFGDVYAFIAKT